MSKFHAISQKTDKLRDYEKRLQALRDVRNGKRECEEFNLQIRNHWAYDFQDVLIQDPKVYNAICNAMELSMEELKTEILELAKEL